MPNEYGLDKEIAEKIASKYDPAMEKEAQDWIEQVGRLTTNDTPVI